MGKKSPHGAPRRFITEVALLHSGDDCLIWPFARMGKGYGKLRHEGGEIGAHRLVCTLAHGPAPSPIHEAAHSCGHGFDACVSPHHIAWKTPKENAADKLSHDTHNRGERHGLAKLTEADVRYIHTQKGKTSQATIARSLGCSWSAVHRVITKETWSWLSA